MKIGLSVMTALAFAAGAAQANDKPKRIGFDAYDKNNDGVITRSEARGHPVLSKRFNAIDKDKDGRISRTEWLASRSKTKTHAARKPVNQDARFNSLDRNKDGVLNRSEARGHLDDSASTGRTRP
jgi:Ca2+-binding EF-hand superfamily protein